MPQRAATEAAVFAFAEPSPGAWGAGVIDSGGEVALVAGHGEAWQFAVGSAREDATGERWEIDAGGSALAVARGETRRPALRDVLCHVSGRISLDGAADQLECAGWLQAPSALDAAQWISARQLAAWFASGEGVALTALRTHDARAHAEDVVHAEILGGDGPEVEDPRLSSTYDADGIPSRAGLELWVARAESDELYPVRAAGEAVGPLAAIDHAGQHMIVRPFRWHSRGREGCGVYLLRRRA